MRGRLEGEQWTFKYSKQRRNWKAIHKILIKADIWAQAVIFTGIGVAAIVLPNQKLCCNNISVDKLQISHCLSIGVSLSKDCERKCRHQLLIPAHGFPHWGLHVHLWSAFRGLKAKQSIPALKSFELRRCFFRHLIGRTLRLSIRSFSPPASRPYAPCPRPSGSSRPLSAASVPTQSYSLSSSFRALSHGRRQPAE
jgi:hypothetical protein